MAPTKRSAWRPGSRPLVDERAFVVLYREQAEAVVAFFARRTFDPETAADLTAETFAEAFSSRARFREQGHGAAAWLFGIAQHKLQRYYRSGRIEVHARARLAMPQSVDLSDSDYERIDELIDLDARSVDLRGAMARLSELEREALRVRVIESRPYREVASQLGCSEEAARVRVARGLRHLQTLLATLGRMAMNFELEFLNRLESDLQTAGVRAARRRPWSIAIRAGAAAAVAAVLVLVGIATLPWGSHDSSAVAAIEQRVRGLEVVHGANGDALDSSQATILGSSRGVYLITGMRLVSGVDGQCAGVLAPRPLDDSFRRLPSSDLYFGDYSCADSTSRGGSMAILRIGDGGTGLVGSVPDTVARVTLNGVSGVVDLPLHDGWYGTVIPYSQPAPTQVTEYGPGGGVVGSFALEPASFAKGYVPPSTSSPHSTLIAKALPDGRPITIERTEVDRFGAYAFFLSLDGQPVKAALWGIDGPAPTRPEFWTDDVLAVGDVRVLVIGTQAGATVTAALDDGTPVPVEVDTVGPNRGVALVVLDAAQASGTLTITGAAPDGNSLKSDTVDLPSARVIALHETN